MSTRAKLSLHMIRFYRLGLFTFLVCLFLGQAIVIARHYSDVMDKQGLVAMREMQKTQIALVLVSFHSYYHDWPVSPGQLDDNAYFELVGDNDDKINTQHINFFEKNNCDGDLVDGRGNYLWFKPDDSIGTCSVYAGQ